MTRRIVLVMFLMSGNLAVSGAEASWPHWRGPDRTGISKDTGLLKKWPEGGPKRVWLFQNAGMGYSGFSIVGDRLYTLGARKDKEQLIALDANVGKEVWAADIGSVLSNNWGDGPRSTPTVDGDHVYALSGQGTLICVEAKDGKLAWKRSMESLSGKVPDWGYTESVLVDGERVVCTPGEKKGAMVALSKKTGDVLWQSKDFTDGAQYASIVPADFNGERQYIQLTKKSIVGIAASDGRLLWRADWPGQTAVVPTPIFRDGLLYVTSGYGVGCKLLKLGEGHKVMEVYFNKEMKNHHGGVILVGDHVYGYSDGPGWVCQEFSTGKRIWAEKNLGKGAIGCADGMLYLLSEDGGTVVLIEASPLGWKQHGGFKLDPQTKLRKPAGRIWTHPVITGGRLFLRDQEILYCFDLKVS